VDADEHIGTPGSGGSDASLQGQSVVPVPGQMHVDARAPKLTANPPSDIQRKPLFDCTMIARCSRIRTAVSGIEYDTWSFADLLQDRRPEDRGEHRMGVRVADRQLARRGPKRIIHIDAHVIDPHAPVARRQGHFQAGSRE